MASSMNTAGRTKRWLMILALISAFVTVESAYAQRVGGGRGRRPTRPDKPRNVDQDRRDEKPAPGRQIGWVMRLKAAKKKDIEKDEKLMGFLTIKPYDKKQRIVKLRVRRGDETPVLLGEHEFELEQLGKLLEKGLHVAASWDFLNEKEAEKKRGGKKVLRKLELLTIEVEGVVKGVEDDVVEIYGKPVDKGRWPDYVPDEKPGAMPEEVKKSMLKLKLLDDVSTFRTADTSDARLSDFKEDDEVRVHLVYAGRRTGILVGLRTKDASDAPPEQEPGDNRPPPRPRQPKPRGRGGASGG